MAIRTQESLSGFIASDPQLTYTDRGDARFYARFGQDNFQREEDGTFTKLEPSFGNLVLYRATAERAFERFTKGDQFVAEGYAHDYTYERDGQTIAGEEFVAKKIGHDTARTCYDVDRTPRQALERQAAGQAFEPPQQQQTAPAADSLSM
ncbi:single-stranded DNA-binding protein [Ruania albidiflava]|uniref:single-stranded DNA-binding protein n=1 Tax=Actinomycetes TaxID=1760 RepID=UPI0023F575B2|nr:single-stranded DNA-binding protein [Ruania albidiflava]